MINKKIIIASLATTVLIQSSTIGIFANETNINNQVKSIEQNINEDEIVNIPDENLNKNLKKTLFGDENSIRPIKKQDLLLIHRIDLSSKNITNLEGLQYCTNLEILSIDGNQISDITPLSKLTNLTSLGLGENQITDIGALANLTNLTSLTLTNNQIKDINSLKNLNKLTFLSLGENQITDIGALANLTNLTSLRLDMNQITDIGVLANLTNLTNLSLDMNQITDIRALANLTNLTNLGLKDNRISDISAISNLINLTSLTLDKNQIKDIRPLENLIDLPFLSVAYNQISDITPLSKLTNLTRLSIAYNQISDITPISKMNKLERLYVYNQSVKSKEVLSKGNTVAIENSIKTVDGSIVNATNISDGGKYNKDTNLIKWNNITSDFNATYEFNKNVSIGKTNATFSGIVTQPIKYSNNKPVISGAENISIIEGTKFDTMEGVTATDTEDGNITNKVKVTGTVDTNRPGKYELTYTVRDTDGNTTTVKRVVIVNPKMAAINAIPVIKAENKTIKVGDKFNPMTGVTATDKEDVNITKYIRVIENTVDTSKVGTYKLVYEVTDSKGAKATKTITVTVINGNIENTTNNNTSTESKPSGNTDNIIGNNEINSNKTNNSQQNNQVTSNDSSNPQTGDTGILGFVGLGVASLVGLVSNRKRRK
ncbi:Ig-like domain-containing protein,Leucine Rich Repeat (LRR)-containing protein,putative S-layer protein,Internalin-A precursor,Protein prenyltransferase, alpha subunit,Leucine Rich repeats (2 copies) [[Clostridium] sordellii]|uniref:leucine-rich repeat domain-containing protein n=1 Tax=Paraclostridium sordellii TaxID=1505 RepID=UPI0005425BE2|nr:leucine-rich repeat domain-containing protein [Paeniclostridium sordellii]CEK36548.1 Ig-like domain-containing protein,Leucine Rich Repeat (LRR)-containing protein,putative S-layer protein,Internalin-A precursor,Protein prenyltransferase, alpha subunit,Leucine Rich repeats (2 copies) [[Clostridium] sordellii] [Paeniclostridium sordellii]